MKTKYLSTFSELNQSVKEILFAGKTILAVRVTAYGESQQFMISFIDGIYTNYSELAPDEYYYSFQNLDEMIVMIDRHLTTLGEIRGIHYNFDKKVYSVRFRNQRETRMITEIIGGPEYLDNLEHSIVNMQIHFRRQLDVRNELCSYYDCSADEAMSMLRYFNLDVPSHFKSLDDWMKSTEYQGFRIKKFYDETLDLDTLDD